MTDPIAALLGITEDTAVSSRCPQLPPELGSIYAECASFVWRSLQRLGVRHPDLDDVCHDVFVIVQRKLPEFRQGAQLQPWLLAICARTAANYRRRAHIRLEQSIGAVDGKADAQPVAPELGQPDNALERQRALALAASILARMSAVKRSVFIMFEVEGLSCQEIAAELSLPVGTVYSRLHSARKLFLEHGPRAVRRAEPEQG